MKKMLFGFLSLSLALVLLCSCSFVIVGDEGVTGDVKTDTETQEIVSDENVSTEDDKQNEAGSEDKEIQDEPDNKPLTVAEIVSGMGAEMSDGGEYKENAILFADAIMQANTLLVAEYTGGEDPDYYSFLENAEIESYEIYPFTFSEETIAETESATDSYYNSYDCYFVDFTVTRGDGEYFTDGSNVYLMAFGQDPIAGGILSEFVPYEMAMGKIFTVWKGDLEYDTYFIREFLSLYRGELFEGKNYPSEFDFSDSVHLITHLMARSGKYRNYPPYSLEEINEFIAHSFEGNTGLVFENEREIENWTVGASYAVTDEDREQGRLYGCALAHGGTTAEHHFDKIETEDENIKTVTVTLYADYAHFAKSKQVVLTIEQKAQELPRMLSLLVVKDESRSIAYVSV